MEADCGVLVARHERPHRGIAHEHFLPAGPFAILPLTGKRSSLVWTETRKEAARITGLGEAHEGKGDTLQIMAGKYERGELAQVVR